MLYKLVYWSSTLSNPLSTSNMMDVVVPITLVREAMSKRVLTDIGSGE